MNTVLITTPTFARFSDEPWDILKAVGEAVRPYDAQAMPSEELLARVPAADALIVGTDVVTAEVLDAAPRLRVVAKHGVGTDNIDVESAHRRGIRVVNAPGSNTQAVADLTFGLLLAAARSIIPAHSVVMHGRWDRLYGAEVSNKTLGIIGFGQIGRAVARRARGFDMRVLAHDPYTDPSAVADAGAVQATFRECVRNADFLSLHLPAAPDSGFLLDRAAIRAMRPGAYLVNAARGGLVDEAALAEALHDGHVAAAALDVFGEEPPEGSPLLHAPNVLCTPHIGACSYEANRNMGTAVANDIVRVLGGNEPTNAVY
ncbi:phosphoglycerate dehydrogenase [Haloactinomyces albus]|uniref:D-3-phosphoglycerate dehydrogenase n=1 Tax=Haloactinomyces albus TaxID=1352928 RepID=A0AAE3ZJG6_9ACTN|nr:phosphoglycerate dehydrogenase [Haloactinomyces albus]MDR7304019.1 D-3-phosphoglycerate dehydrogenase [Haloactinomyces albus]